MDQNHPTTEVDRFPRRRDRDEDERSLRDDVRRTAGYMAAVVERADRLGLVPPADVSRCVAQWRLWLRRLEAGPGPDDL